MLLRRLVGPPLKLYRGPRAAVEVTYVRVGQRIGGEFYGLGSLVHDAREVVNLSTLKTAHETVSSWVRSLRPAEALRLVVVLPLKRDEAPEARACSEALVAHSWSAAREIGPRFGATANILRVDDWSKDAENALHFLLSGRAACVSRTELEVPSAETDSESAQQIRRRRTRNIQGSPRLFSDYEDDHSDVRGLRCLVTGAFGGIGRAVVRRLTDLGAKIALVDAKGGNDSSWPFRAVDYLNEEDCGAAKISEFTKEIFGDKSVDVVAHVSGAPRDRTLRKMSPRDWDDCMRINYMAPMAIDKALAPKTSILFSSVVASTGNFGQANYSSAKRALKAFAEASDASHDPNYRVIAPGYVDTPMTRKHVPWLQRIFAAHFASTLQQPVLPEDVANATAFLASPKSKALRGQTLRVCGGFLIA